MKAERWKECCFAGESQGSRNFLPWQWMPHFGPPRCVIGLAARPLLTARFLRYEPFNHPKAFKTHIKEEITHNPAKGFRKLQALLRAVLLRRTKGSTIGGQPIIALPERRQQLLKIEFSRDEAALHEQARF